MLFNKKDPKEEFQKGIKTIITFPEKQTKAHTIVGLGTGGTVHKEHNIQRKTILRVAEKGLVFEKANNDGSDYRLPWEEIISIEPVTKSLKITLPQVKITLVDGRELKVGLKPKKHDSFISLCEPNIQGNVADGW